MEGGPVAPAPVCAPLYETLVAAFPRGLMQEGLEHSIRGKVRRKLRHIGYNVEFQPGEPWQIIVEHFAIAGIDRIHRGFGDNPWFWVVSWPSVFGAAAAEFWPEVGTPEERHSLAAAASAGHLEAILITRALIDSESIGALPNPALKGLRALGQSALPALPSVSVSEKALMVRPKLAAPPITPVLAAPKVLSPDSGEAADNADPSAAGPAAAAQTEVDAAAAGKVGPPFFQGQAASPEVEALRSWQIHAPMPAGAVRLLRPPPRPESQPSATAGKGAAEKKERAPAPASEAGAPRQRTRSPERPRRSPVATPGIPSVGAVQAERQQGPPAPVAPRRSVEREASEAAAPPAVPIASHSGLDCTAANAAATPPRPPSPEPPAPGALGSGLGLEAMAAAAAPQPLPPEQRADADGAVGSGSSQACGCGGVAVRAERAAEVYGEVCTALCDQCGEPCGEDSPGEARKGAFLHCAGCSRDLCAECARASST
mmetsp:Transcript_104711/g.312768  ORF Transcript_104711/g.312768 Transcript_104711/m.312768 type:complete len:486 (-) Transcript_104711:157-1614(-)